MADFGGDAEAFRLEARAWLEANFPASLKDAPMAQMAAAFGGMEERPDAKLWRERMGAKGWGAPTWPKQYGGGGLTRQEARVLAEEMARLGARNPIGGMGVIDVRARRCWSTAPRRRSSSTSRRSCRGELRWCQGYSEPGAGLGPRVAADQVPRTRATTTWSTARRSGPRAPSTPTGASAWCAPIPRPRSTRASASC